MKNNKHIKSIIALTLALGIISTGCGSSNEPTTNTPSAESTLSTPTTLTDRSGVEITKPTEINSVITLVPSITETLVDLGLGDKIIGTDTYSLATEGLNPDVVELDAMTPDIEKILTLKPDVVIALGSANSASEDPLKQLTDAGILVTYIPTANSLDDISLDISFLGELTGTEQRATEIIVAFNSTINSIQEQVATYQDGGKTVYFEISPAPYMYTFGSDVFLNEIIELLGCENVFADQESWIPATSEEVLARNPQMIFTNNSDDANAVSEIQSREGWSVIDAVKNNEIYVVDKNSSSQPNEYVIECIKEMAQIIYPDIKLD